MDKTTPQGDGEVGLCAFCGAIATLKCGNCKQVFYCKRECQKEDWKKAHKEECKAVKIVSDTIRGRCLVSVKDFKAGDVIFREEPLVLGPKQMTEPICLTCYKKVDGTYRCSQCTWPLCGPQCEKSIDHQPECVVGQEIGSPIDIPDFNDTNHFYEVVLPLRCLALKKRSPNKYEQLLNLESHYEERKSLPLYKENKKNIVDMLRNYFMLAAFSQDVIDSSEYMIQRITGILDTNAVDITWEENDISGIYPMFCMMEHSCIPNIKYSFNKKKQVIVKAGMNIKRGDHLCTMYTHMLWGTIARREHLRVNKYFMCTCPRCADPTEMGSHFSSLKCQECRVAYMTSAAPLDQLADWICSNCNARMSIEAVKNLTDSLGEEITAALCNPTKRSLEYMIETKSSVVHPNHFHLFALKHTLLQMYGRSEDPDDNVMILKEKLCKSFLEICSALDPAMIRLASYASVALYEYHVAIMARKRKPDGTPQDPQSILKDIEIAKALLHQCIAVISDEPAESAEGKLRSLAATNLEELEQVERGIS